MDFIKNPEFQDFLLPQEFDADEYARCIVANRRYTEKDEENPFHVKQITGTCDISSSLRRLQTSLDGLQGHLSQIVAEAHDDMLGAVSGLQSVEKGLEIAKTGMGNLRGIIQRLKGKISEPLHQLQQLETRLERLLELTELMKRVSKALTAGKRLEGQIKSLDTSDPTMLASAALTTAELAVTLHNTPTKQDPFANSGDLDGIKVVDDMMHSLQQSRNVIQTSADVFIEKGMSEMDVGTLGIGLLIWRNLGPAAWEGKSNDAPFTHKLLTIVDQVVQQHVTIPLNEAFDSASLKSLSTDLDTRDKIFEKLEASFDAMFQGWKKIYLLDKVVQRRREPMGGFASEDISGKTWHEEAFSQTNLVSFFRQRFTNQLDSQLKQATKSSNALLQALQNYYPRLLRLAREFESRVEGAVDLNNLLTPYQNGFLQKSATRVFDSLTACFPQEGKSTGLNVLSGTSNAVQQLLAGNLLSSSKQQNLLPAKDNILRFMRSLSGEMEAARFDAKLLQNVTRHISRAVMTICAKIDGSINWDTLKLPVEASPDSKSFMLSMQVPQDSKQRAQLQPGQSIFVVAPNLGLPPPQILTAVDALVLELVLEDGLWKLIDEMATSDTPGIVEALEGELVPILTEHLRPLIVKTASSLMSACTREVDVSLQRQKPGWIQEVDVKLAWITVHIFTKLVNAVDRDSQHLEEIYEWVQAIAARVVQLTLRHGSQSKSIDKRIVRDYESLESVVSTFLEKSGVRGGIISDSGKADDYATPGALGRQIRFLQLFKSNVEQPLKEFIAATKGSIPTPLLLHHIIASSPPQTLLLPTERLQWTLGQYSDWIDTHSSQEHLDLLEQGLDAYVVEVQRKGEKEFCPEFVDARQVLGK